MFASKDTLLTRPSGYNIARSVRVRNSASGYFNRTPSSASNRQTWTFSGWVKRGILTTRMSIFAGYTGTTNGTLRTQIIILDGGAMQIGSDQMQTATDFVVETTQVFRDPSAWYHIVVAVDTTQATASNRVKLYVNGVQVTSFSTATYPSQNYQGGVNYNSNQYINRFYDPSGGNYYGDGYLTEINFVDGQQLTASSFGETDSITGVWKPKAYSGTYGTNGFELNFSDNSNNTAATIGKDYSGNGNNWTPNNISVTAGSTYDSMTDVPTLSGAGSNYAVLNPLIRPYSGTTDLITNGNLRASSTSGPSGSQASTITFTSGKFYCEATATTVSGANVTWIGVCNNLNYYALGTWASAFVRDYGYSYASNGKSYSTSTPSGTTYGASYTSGDVIGLAIDADAGTITFYKNGTSQGTAFTGMSYTGGYAIGCTEDNSNVVDFNFGQRPFTYTPPTGFVALNTFNLPDSTIKNGGLYMKPVLYTGNGSNGLSITGVGFQTDFNWTKSRSSASYSHQLSDSVRGFSKYLYSNATNAEGTDATNHIQSVNSDGYVINSGASFNASGVTYVAWNWKAGTTSSSNTNGSITSTVSAGATQGFSVVKYTGTGTTGTVGHGLGVAPSMIIVKSRSFAGSDWDVYHASTGNTGRLFLNTTAAFQTVDVWNNTSPTSTVFTVNGSRSDVNASSETYVAYCFAAVKGFSAFGSYTGNGSSDGPFVYTGFRPRWIMVKRTDSTSNWYAYDSSRNTANPESLALYPNASYTEDTEIYVDFLSNGFKCRSSTVANISGGTYIYACFAEVPFKSALAR